MQGIRVGMMGMRGIRMGMRGIGVKVIQEKLQKLHLQVITGACVKIAVLEICSERKWHWQCTVYSGSGISLLIHKRCFAGLCQQIFEEKMLQRPS